MKLSDYVMKFLEGKTDSIFLLSGGGIMHLVDSVRKSKLKAYCCQHEQGAAIAAEGYARIKNNIGVVLVTTGPGGTNAITGAAGAWLDSIPMLIISGQVKTDNIVERKENKPLYRQLGFQELNVIDMVKSVTKYAVTVLDKNKIKSILEKAVFEATSGRPGPVWVEIPLDIQAEEINESNLVGYKVTKEKKVKLPIEKVVNMLEAAKKPLLMAGNGIRLSGGVKELDKFLKKTKINVVTPMFTAVDLVTDNYERYLGRQGMPGTPTANYAIGNCDLLLIIGERMQLTQSSYDYKNFASGAKKIMVDIDKGELYKKTLKIDLPIWADAMNFLKELNKRKINLSDWKVKVPEIRFSDYGKSKKYINVYEFVDELSKYSKDFPIATANGMASTAPNQCLKIHKGQRMMTNAGLGHMGSGLPLAIGACIANKKKTTICMEGDGSLMLNIQELQTVIHNKLPIKIFVYNNSGYFSIRNTHQNYFGKVFAADLESGVSLPNYEKLIKGWGLKYTKIGNSSDLRKLRNVFEQEGPVFCELMIDPYQQMLPKWTANQYKDEKK